ncbi:BREX-2 system adenine-specific DNA-methyltransferase PglX, partial [Rhodococcoides fascians]|uniref:BREX-2 system adenine-specific DNA-methyltransferase PglX n=1 Tax=Rhodococcoides fascians TaxID=1828 RepID=UPI001427C616
VDINPFAVAIARFRLLIAALHAAGDTNLEQPIGYTTHLAAGDSLLWGAPQQALSADLLTLHAADDEPATNSTENTDALEAILQREHDAVVGNPPYITVKDKALNAIYRQLYTTTHRQYALTVPFMELFFRLARDGRDNRSPAGWVGQITSNSFMKREFGTKLIEEFLPTVDLKDIIDTSGAYIPGHGTPTVIITGRNTTPTSDTIHTVLGKRGEPGRPLSAEKGVAWNSITRHIDDANFEDEFVTVRECVRLEFRKHPWNLGAGESSNLLKVIALAPEKLADRLPTAIGGAIRAGADDAFSRPVTGTTNSNEADTLRLVVAGDAVRDWKTSDSEQIVYPYHYGTKVPVKQPPTTLWSYRTLLAARGTFSGNMAEAGLQWWEYMQHTINPYLTPLSITFAEIATHNHFVLDRGGKIFKQTAPVIKLAKDATEAEYLSLLAALNTSTACFWLKHNCHNKGEGGGARVDAGYAARGEAWRESYQFNGTSIKDFPLHLETSRERAHRLDRLASGAASLQPAALIETEAPLPAALEAARVDFLDTSNIMHAVQEELDWDYYRIYGLIEDDLTFLGELPPVALGGRAFEIFLARRILAGHEESTWFTHPLHRSTPVTEIPAHLPADYRDLVQRRLDVIASNPHIELLERPEYKRRWATEPWDKQVLAAQRTWLLDRLENRDL